MDEYANNMEKRTTVEIMKDNICRAIGSGEDVLEILKMTVKALSEATNDNAFYVENKRAIIDVYGIQKGIATPLRWEIAERQEHITAINKTLLTHRLSDEDVKALTQEKTKYSARIQECKNSMKRLPC